MKIRICFQTPNALERAVETLVLSDHERERLEEIAKRFILHKQILTIEVDLDSGHASVIPLSGFSGEANVMRHLDLSTRHVPNSKPDFGSLRVEEHEYGWVVWTMSDWDECPGWLIPILEKANKLDCQLILFDVDADECDDLPTYDW